ncbi:ALDH-like protein [Morchella conica CCBAS932]|uniref:aldehyde dehydrogenase (NAD(+)) n=1 Tax=Morchella conica CCBAS932 TaxID=1392247 RepID=A0A3N4KWC4_9PEZI|nr:ALDH-like protein [Morchella conica CCBAS932]
MNMRVSFDFLVSGFTVGCSISRDNFSLSSFDDSLLSTQSLAVSVITIITSILVFRYWRSLKYAAVSYEIPIPKQCSEEWTGDILDNPSIRTTTDNNINCYCPANGKFLGEVTPASPEDIDNAIAKSAVAQKQWARTSFEERKRVLRTLQKYILSNRDIIIKAACLDSGKTRIDASLGEILVLVEKIKWILGYGESALKPERRSVSWPLMCYKKAEVRYEPLGVVCACVSWNYPFHNLLCPIVSSIFAGNGIIVKGSENTAWSSHYFISIVKGALEACGHNSDLVESITCWPDVAPHLTSHSGISHITFIGSRPVAHHVAASASKSLIPLCIELGGKDAAIILDDIPNVNILSSILMRGVFQSASQNCVGIERVIALPKVYPRLVNILEERIKLLRPGSILDGDEVDCGAMISSAGFDKLEEWIHDAVQKGAKCLVGGKRYLHPKHPKGHYFSPTLLIDVTPDMLIAQNETFAPVFVLMKAGDVHDAIDIANGTEFGLGGSVFGRNKRDLQKVVQEMKSGMVSVNDFGVYYLNQSLPFGGVKGSGYGRFAGEEGLRAVCNLKAVCEDIFPGLLSTAIPPVVDYPIRNGDRGLNFTTGLIELAYGETWKRTFGGLWKLVTNL